MKSLRPDTHTTPSYVSTPAEQFDAAIASMNDDVEVHSGTGPERETRVSARVPVGKLHALILGRTYPFELDRVISER